MEKEINKGWSLDNDIWCLLYRELEKLDIHWNTITLNEIISESVPNENGVYIISGELPKKLNGLEDFNFYTPLYVGQSSKLRDRFLAHCKGKTGSATLSECWNTSTLKFKFGTINKKVDNRDISILTNDIEALLIKAFGPISNKRNQLLSDEKYGKDLER